MKYHQDTDAQMAQILKLKTQYPAAFSMDNYQAIQQNITIDNATTNGVISYTIHLPQGKFIVFYNATNQPVQIGNGSTANLSNDYHDVNFNYGVNRASNNEITNQNGQLSVPGLSYVVYRFDS